MRASTNGSTYMVCRGEPPAEFLVRGSTPRFYWLPHSGRPQPTSRFFLRLSGSTTSLSVGCFTKMREVGCGASLSLSDQSEGDYFDEHDGGSLNSERLRAPIKLRHAEVRGTSRRNKKAPASPFYRFRRGGGRKRAFHNFLRPAQLIR